MKISIVVTSREKKGKENREFSETDIGKLRASGEFKFINSATPEYSSAFKYAYYGSLIPDNGGRLRKRSLVSGCVMLVTEKSVYL
jgi:hypothetical protein